MGKLIRLNLPGPTDCLRTDKPHGPPVWNHDGLSPELLSCSPLTQLLWFKMQLFADYHSGELDMTTRQLAKHTGIERRNLRRHLRALEAKHLIEIHRAPIPGKVDSLGRQMYRRTHYVLMTPPSALYGPPPSPGQVPLPFPRRRRLNAAEARALRARAEG